MEQMVMAFLEAMENLAQYKKIEPKREVYNNNGVTAKLVTNSNMAHFYIRSNAADAKEAAAKMKCTQIREEFYKYIKTLDEDMFDKICSGFKFEKFKTFHTNIENNNSDPESLLKETEYFKAFADKIIMDEVVRLKSQMSNFKQS